MKKISFLEGTLVALVLSIGITLFFNLSQLMVPVDLSLCLSIVILSGVYLSYLLYRSQEKVGKVTTVTIWSLLSLATWVFIPSILLTLFVHAILISIIRSLYYYQSVLSALFDLLLTGLSLSIAFWAITETQSVGISTWCFFLTQALFSIIPTSLNSKKNSSDKLNSNNRFEHAYHAAQLAIKKLSSSN